MFANHPGFTGCDINPKAIAYLKTLPFGRFDLTKANPPLPYADNSFDVVFGLSVLTHLNETSLRAWLKEFRRVLKPGGILAQTTLGPAAIEFARPSPRANIGVSEDDFAIITSRVSERGFGWSRHCFATECSADYGIAVQTEDYIRREWRMFFKILEVEPAAIDDWQDLVVAQKT
jgi:SAM-dependent methyltransferase